MKISSIFPTMFLRQGHRCLCWNELRSFPLLQLSMETGRLTDERIELGDEERDLLDRKQQYLQEIIADRPEITVTFFVPDEKKSGGSYTAITGNLKRVDLYERLLVLTDGKKIPLDDIADIKGDCFHDVL